MDSDDALAPPPDNYHAMEWEQRLTGEANDQSRWWDCESDTASEDYEVSV